MLQQPEAGPNVDAHHRAKKNLSEQTVVNCLGSHTYYILLAAENNLRLCAVERRKHLRSPRSATNKAFRFLTCESHTALVRIDTNKPTAPSQPYLKAVCNILLFARKQPWLDALSIARQK